MPPNLIHYATGAEYRHHYLTYYCQAQIYTFDGIRVHFPQQQFDDAFFESADRRARDKSVFSWRRAKRIAWIGAALADANAELYAGWDRDKGRANRKRRVIVVYSDYVVIIQISASRSWATFITAYVADPATLQKIRGMPRW